MKERPIIFSGAMVRAILAGSKTQTRRVIKPHPQMVTERSIQPWDGDAAALLGLLTQTGKSCPYGQPSDRLWVREAWQYAGFTEDGYPFVRYSADSSRRLHDQSPSEEWSQRWIDIWAGLSEPSNFDIDGTASDRRWRPSIHMPRWASRITLEITGVRVERLQDISKGDAKAEGCDHDDPCDHVRLSCADIGCEGPDYRVGYRHLWERINGPGSWDANPWVWVVEFKRLEAT